MLICGLYKTRMDELTRVVTGLRLTCPSINLEQLLALHEPRASFEAHFPAETGKDFWLYTVDGKTLDGECIVVRAALPQLAEQMAQEGLAETIKAARKYDANTGLQAEVQVRPMQ